MKQSARIIRNNVPYTLLSNGTTYGEPVHVPSVTAARLLPDPPPPSISIGSAGQTVTGSYYWDETSTATDDGQTVIKVTAITTGRYKPVSIVASGGGSGLSVATVTALKAVASSTLTDTQPATIQNPGSSWVWFGSSGANIPSDDINVIKPNDVSLGTNGRWFNISTFVNANNTTGVKGDNSSDDISAWNTIVASLGSSSTRTRSGHIIAANRTSCLSSTLLLNRFSGVLSGAGTGTSANTQSAIKWIGTTGDPLIQLQRCWATHIENLRLIGSAAHPPSAAIDFHTINGQGPYNTDISIENVWVGGISSEDTVISNGFQNGITFTGVGDPVQNDQSSIRKCMFQDISTVGVDIQTAQATIIAIEDCKFNAVPIGVQTVSRGLVIKNSFFSTVDKCVNLAGDSGVHIENCGSEGCGQLLVAEGGTGGGITIRGEYFQVNADTVAADGSAVIDINGGGSAVHLDIRDLTISSDGTPSAGEIKIRVTNCSHLTLICKNVNWYDGLGLDDHVDIATVSSGQTRLVVWEFEGKEYVNYWEHGAHANAMMGQRVDHPSGVTMSQDDGITVIAVDGTTREILKWNRTGPFANYAELGDSVTPLACGNDFRARVAGCDIREFRNLTGLLGQIDWDASSKGGVKIIPNEGSPEGVVTAEPGSVCLDYDTPGLYFKASGSGNTGWRLVFGTGSVTRVLRGMPFVVEADTDVDEYGRVVINTAAGTVVKIPVEVPDGATLTALTLQVIGGGNADLPAVIPLFRLRTLTIASNSTATSSAATDSSANVGIYNAQHAITLSGLSEVINNETKRYVIEFVSESGANATTGFVVISASATITTAAPDRGAA